MSTEQDRLYKSIGKIKRLLGKVVETQKAHSKRFDVQQATMEEMRQEIASQNERMDTVVDAVNRILIIVEGLFKRSGETDERLERIESKLQD